MNVNAEMIELGTANKLRRLLKKEWDATLLEQPKTITDTNKIKIVEIANPSIESNSFLYKMAISNQKSAQSKAWGTSVANSVL